MEKSKGHICFVQFHLNPDMVQTDEFFERGGAVFRAPVLNAIMPDGYRDGRYEATSTLWYRYKAALLCSFERVISSSKDSE